MKEAYLCACIQSFETSFLSLKVPSCSRPGTLPYRLLPSVIPYAWCHTLGLEWRATVLEVPRNDPLMPLT